MERLKVNRERHDHEWILLSGRVNSLLASQSFLIVASTALYHPLMENQPSDSSALAELFLALLGLIICIFSSVVISINCRVIRDWHKHLNHLYVEDVNYAPIDTLKGLHIPRNHPDILHTISTDIFSVGLPVIFGVFWLTLLIYAHSNYEFDDFSLTFHSYSAVILGILTLWAILIALIFRDGGLFKKNSIEPKFSHKKRCPF